VCTRGSNRALLCGPSTSPLGALVTFALSPRIVLAAGWIAFYGCYLVWAGFTQRNWFWDLFGFVALVGAVGAVFRWRWSQWLVYCVAAAIVGIWLYGLAVSLRAGGFPYETLELNALGLVPGFVLLAATIWSADIVRRRFRSPQSTPNNRWRGP
jgi:hypothetical protein